jgi:adenylate kinase family enzyme
VRDTKIILVEGMPGTGKSTASQFIYRQLCANHFPSYWYHEECSAHPVRLSYDRQRHLSWSEYRDDAMSLWSSYVGELQSRNQIAVLDASILQNHVRSMLLFDCERNSILDLVGRIESVLAPLHPLWIYLKPTDVERNFRDVVEVRGEHLLDLWVKSHDQFPYARRARESGFPGFIAFWQEFGEISDRVFNDLAIPKLQQSVSFDDGDARFSELLDFVGLPSSTDLPSSLSQERFQGRYLPLDNQSASGFLLRASNGGLIICCDKPTMDVESGPIGCYRELRLIPIDSNRFYVSAWPHEIEFIEDGTTSVVSMRLSASEDEWAECDELYVRQ